MACASNKRRADWGSWILPAKRRRSDPLNQLDVTCSSRSVSNNCDGLPNTINQQTYASGQFSGGPTNISSEEIIQNIESQLKGFQKRKYSPVSNVALRRISESNTSGSEMATNSFNRTSSSPNMEHNPEKAMFTFNEVKQICAHRLKQQEEALREQYDAALTNRLAEQYDTFLKFTHDQIQKSYETPSSYYT